MPRLIGTGACDSTAGRKIPMMKVLGAAVVGGALFISSFTGAGAAPNTFQDGLVNVNVGNVNIARDADIGVAAQVAANVCGVKVGPVAILATQVDASGAPRTVCT